MCDPLYKPYVVLARDRRIDVAGPFATLAEAEEWAACWDEFIEDFRSHVTLLRDSDGAAQLAQAVSQPSVLAHFCAPEDLDWYAARDWGVENSYSFHSGLPPVAADAAP